MTTTMLKRIIFGRPLKTSEIEGEKMPVWKALPILSSDALSSVAYGTQQILLELAVVGAAAFAFSLPIALTIIALITLLIISYRQVIDAYPQGGGAYMVAKENLGMFWGRLAGVSLLIDYTLTVAVSVSAGIQAITSAFPSMMPYLVPMCFVAVLFMVGMNLRGTSESGTIFSIPTYLFIACMLLLVGKGFFDMLTGGSAVHTAAGMTPVHIPQGLTWFIVLKAFSSGCSAVTGVEAISNAVPHFRAPAKRNAKLTMVTLGILLSVIFGGVTLFALQYGVQPDPTGTVSVLSMVAESAFGRGAMYFMTQLATMLVLILAANTSFNGFPILASIMAQDKNFARMFAHRGDRLAFHHGIITLGILSAILLIAFQGKTDALIPLYAIGVFLSFTLSQTGLVKKWLRERGRGWQRKAAINGVGAVVTFCVTILFSITKFMEGAWVVVLLTPLLVWFITKVYRHYETVGNELRICPDFPLPDKQDIVVIVPVAGIHRVVASSLAYAKQLTDNVVAFYVAMSDEDEEKLTERWEEWNPGVRLVVFKSRYRTINRPLKEFIERIDANRGEKQTIIVMLPQFITTKWWHRFLHNQSAHRIRKAIQSSRDIVVATVPYHLKG